MVMLHIKLNCSNMVANILPVYPTTLGVGSKGQNSIFTERGSCAYEIKGNHECTNMQAHTCILSLHTPSTFGVGSKVKAIFTGSSHVAYQIEVDGA